MSYNDDIICPFCGEIINPSNIMGDSDWDDQEFEWCNDNECPDCEGRFKIKQSDVEIIRHFEIEKDE